MKYPCTYYRIYRGTPEYNRCESTSRTYFTVCVEDIRKFAEVDVPHENVGARTQVRAQAWPNAHEKRMNENQDTAQSKHLSFLSVWIGLQTADALRPRQHALLSVCKALRDAQSQAQYYHICDELAAMGEDSSNALGQLLFFEGSMRTSSNH